MGDHEKFLEIYHVARANRFTWADYFAPEEYINSKMELLAGYVDKVKEVQPGRSYRDICGCLGITVAEYDFFKEYISVDDDMKKHYREALKETQREGYYTPVAVKHGVNDILFFPIVKQHHLTALLMMDDGQDVGWIEEQKHRAEMICSYWNNLEKEEGKT